MRNLLTLILVLPVAALLILLALANRAPVTLSLDPFSPEVSAYSIQLPLFVVIVAAIALGLIIGSLADWISQGRYRREARDRKYEVRRLEEEAARLRAQVPVSTLPVPYGDQAR
ncbi:LapA family protein [Terrihabitans rhizophilus]|jgi:uncharacterized integral membrane protein|uniref:LapA family protein n=1 Tax=Terrihabitans rhizophilus TaxID=3092662 RepID=A0ABU4RIG6_9HYPH|nr:LapA family protein [Terrihabitans sp. PJ23]MDX6804622.1 LapA family protein [Terrihabitans sp. PJ23]